MEKYGTCAAEAVKMIVKIGVSPPEAWRRATVRAFGAGAPGQKKACPRAAFLALCQHGMIRGVPKGNYTTSKKCAS
jgi:hypothetical protein